MDNKMRYSILGMLFSLMGILICFKSIQNGYWQMLLLAIPNLIAGVYCFFLLGKQRS